MGTTGTPAAARPPGKRLSVFRRTTSSGLSGRVALAHRSAHSRNCAARRVRFHVDRSTARSYAPRSARSSSQATISARAPDAVRASPSTGRSRSWCSSAPESWVSRALRGTAGPLDRPRTDGPGQARQTSTPPGKPFPRIRPPRPVSPPCFTPDLRHRGPRSRAAPRAAPRGTPRASPHAVPRGTCQVSPRAVRARSRWATGGGRGARGAPRCPWALRPPCPGAGRAGP